MTATRRGEVPVATPPEALPATPPEALPATPPEALPATPPEAPLAVVAPGPRGTEGRSYDPVPGRAAGRDSPVAGDGTVPVALGAVPAVRPLPAVHPLPAVPAVRPRSAVPKGPAASEGGGRAAQEGSSVSSGSAASPGEAFFAGAPPVRIRPRMPRTGKARGREDVPEAATMWTCSADPAGEGDRIVAPPCRAVRRR